MNATLPHSTYRTISLIHPFVNRILAVYVHTQSLHNTEYKVSVKKTTQEGAFDGANVPHVCM